MSPLPIHFGRAFLVTPGELEGLERIVADFKASGVTLREIASADGQRRIEVDTQGRASLRDYLIYELDRIRAYTRGPAQSLSLALAA